MADLLNRYFEEDLSAREEDQIEAQLESSPEEAERFAGLALAHYQSLSLETPRWSRRRPAPFNMKSWRLPLLLLAAGGAALWALGASEPAGTAWEERESILGMEEMAQAPEKSEAPAKEAARPSKPRESAAKAARPTPAKTGEAGQAVLRGKKLDLVLHQAESGPMQAWIEDASGNRVKELFNGEVEAGTRRVEWDGLLDGGSKARPGEYSVVVRSKAGIQRRPLRLRTSS